MIYRGEWVVKRRPWWKWWGPREQWNCLFTPRLDIPPRSKITVALPLTPALGGPWAFDVDITPEPLDEDSIS